MNFRVFSIVIGLFACLWVLSITQKLLMDSIHARVDLIHLLVLALFWEGASQEFLIGTFSHQNLISADFVKF